MQVGDEIRIFEIVNSPYPIVENGHHCAEVEFHSKTKLTRLITSHTSFGKNVLFNANEIKHVATMRITKIK